MSFFLHAYFPKNLHFYIDICIYKPDSFNKMVMAQKILDSFSSDLKEGRIIPYIQPKYDLQTGKYYGGEVLTRWINKDGEFISPSEFIPVLENTGLISILDQFIFSSIISTIKDWIKQGIKVYPLSFNVSRCELQESDLSKYIIESINKNNIPHELIEVEITESVYIENSQLINTFCKEMLDNNIKVLIDDFGSGYSSLNTLKDLEYNIIKLDYKFLSKTENIEKRNIIIDSVIQMARKLNVRVIIEGVETSEDVEFYRSKQVRYIQGFYFGKPMPIKDYVDLLTKQGR